MSAAQLSGWLPAKGLALTLQPDVLGPSSLGSQVAQAKGYRVNSSVVSFPQAPDV